jgi:hypothetical protein
MSFKRTCLYLLIFLTAASVHGAEGDELPNELPADHWYSLYEHNQAKLLKELAVQIAYQKSRPWRLKLSGWGRHIAIPEAEHRPNEILRLEDEFESLTIPTNPIELDRRLTALGELTANQLDAHDPKAIRTLQRAILQVYKAQHWVHTRSGFEDSLVKDVLFLGSALTGGYYPASLVESGIRTLPYHAHWLPIIWAFVNGTAYTASVMIDPTHGKLKSISTAFGSYSQKLASRYWSIKVPELWLDHLIYRHLEPMEALAQGNYKLCKWLLTALPKKLGLMEQSLEELEEVHPDLVEKYVNEPNRLAQKRAWEMKRRPLLSQEPPTSE